MRTTGLFLALLPLLALRTLAAAAEVVISATPASRQTGMRGERLLAAAASATSYVANATCVGLLVTIAWMHAGRGWVPLFLAIAVPVLLVLFDLVPRGLAAEAAGRRRESLERLLVTPMIVLGPALLLERGLAALLGVRRQGLPLTSIRRLGGWLAARPGRGPLDVSETGLVERIARFAARTARDAMVPHVDVCAVADAASVGEVVRLVQDRGFSRLPIFHERMFNTIGVVSSLDLLGVVDPSLPVTAVMRAPLFVPESKPLPELLATLQGEGRNLALVVDEYGGFVGLVTVEDVVEEIVGEIQDEYDAPREHYRRVARGVFAVSARAPVIDVNERFGWNLPQGEYETLGGLVLERLGRVPKPGDAFEIGRVRIEVTRASARAVQELRVRELAAVPRGAGRRVREREH